MKKILFLSILSFVYSLSQGHNLIEEKDDNMHFYNAKNFTMIGKGNSTSQYYHRVDTSIYSELPPGTKKLLTNSSGLMIAFKTNSQKIKCKWSLSGYKEWNNMTPIVVSGLDLYCKREGKWVYAGVGRPSGINSEYTLVENMDSEEKEFLLYLPLYNTLEDLEIGITEDATIQSIPNPFSKRIVIYGSSITQGASASRPGLSYTSRMGRSMNVEFINLGLSGRGLMEKEAAHMVADIEADMYVLDCASNPSPEIITERTNYLVKHIRSRHPNTPIVMIERTISNSGNLNLTVKETVRNKNINFAKEYRRLIDEGVESLYMVEGEDLLGHDYEATTDGVHPNDIGFSRMIEIIEPALRSVIGKTASK